MPPHGNNQRTTRNPSHQTRPTQPPLRTDTGILCKNVGKFSDPTPATHHQPHNQNLTGHYPQKPDAHAKILGYARLHISLLSPVRQGLPDGLAACWKSRSTGGPPVFSNQNYEQASRLLYVFSTGC